MFLYIFNSKILCLPDNFITEYRNGLNQLPKGQTNTLITSDKEEIPSG